MTDLKDVIWRIREKFPVDHAELLDLADRIEALTAENERLREAVAQHDKAVVQAERDRIVEFLAEDSRGLEGPFWANAIEAGEHLK